jgi:glycosyltransferase involved in cell wall biosynthesis
VGHLVSVIRRADVVYVQRLLPGFLKMFLLKRLTRSIVFDFDDAIMFGRKGESKERESRFSGMVRAARVVFCGNRFLLDQALKYRKDHVLYVPTVVDTAEYHVKRHVNANPFVVGWMGSASTLPYLKEVIPLFDGKNRDRILKVVADKPPEGRSEQICFEKWTGEAEKELLVGFDVGIMPSADDAWSRGKCGLKLIQYAAAGLPAISHPWGVSPDIIDDGTTGFLRTSVEGWKDAMERLRGDLVLRRRMGAAARDVATERYSLHVWGPRVVEMVGSF